MPCNIFPADGSRRAQAGAGAGRRCVCALRPLADRHGRTGRTAAASSGRWPPPTLCSAIATPGCSPARRIEILQRTAGDHAAAPRRTGAGGGPRRAASRWSIRSSRPIGPSTACDSASSTLRTQAGDEIPMNLNAASAGRLAFTRHEPIGVVLAFSAFNHPLNLIVHQVGPAIAAGCPVIVKPAKADAAFVLPLREHSARGRPAGRVVPAAGDAPTRTWPRELVADRRVGFFSFIGSGEVGWMLRSQLAPGARCSLEHGGVAPVIVAADADLDSALPLLAKGGFYHAGPGLRFGAADLRRAEDRRALAERLAETGRRAEGGRSDAARTPRSGR